MDLGEGLRTALRHLQPEPSDHGTRSHFIIKSGASPQSLFKAPRAPALKSTTSAHILKAEAVKRSCGSSALGGRTVYSDSTREDSCVPQEGIDRSVVFLKRGLIGHSIVSDRTAFQLVPYEFVDLIWSTESQQRWSGGSDLCCQSEDMEAEHRALNKANPMVEGCKFVQTCSDGDREGDPRVHPDTHQELALVL
eukprot:766393-Hanusia_phi.AAC.11